MQVAAGAQRRPTAPQQFQSTNCGSEDGGGLRTARDNSASDAQDVSEAALCHFLPGWTARSGKELTTKIVLAAKLNDPVFWLCDFQTKAYDTEHVLACCFSSEDVDGIWSGRTSVTLREGKLMSSLRVREVLQKLDEMFISPPASPLDVAGILEMATSMHFLLDQMLVDVD